MVSKDTAPAKVIELAEKFEGKPYSAEGKVKYFWNSNFTFYQTLIAGAVNKFNQAKKYYIDEIKPKLSPEVIDKLSFFLVFP